MTMNPILSDISEEMRHRIPPNINPLKKYATIYRAYINTKKSQDSEILTKHFNFNHGSKLEEAAGFISPAATSLASII